MSVEERIDKILERKQDLFDRLVDDVSVDLSASLTSDQLFGLFGLELPEQANRERRQRPSGLELEARCARILQKRGWTAERTQRSRDGGIDVNPTGAASTADAFWSVGSAPSNSLTT